MSSDSIKFTSIKQFVSAIGDFFSSHSHSLALYERLLVKTTLCHINAVTKHIEIFKQFCVENRTAIYESRTEFVGLIEYSPKIFIDMNEIFKLCTDQETKSVISQHLLALSALLDPESNAKSILSSATVPTTAEDDFMGKSIEKIKSLIKPDTENFSDAMNDVMQSGFLQEFVSSATKMVESGEFDIKNITKYISGAMSGVSSDDFANDPMAKSTIDMINQFTKSGNL